MLGMLGIIVKNNQIMNTTQILQVVKPGETYLVKFLNPPVFNRVCTTEEIQTWLLFATQEDANAWVAASSGPAPGKETQAPAGKNGVGEDTPGKDLSPGDEKELTHPDDDTPEGAEIIAAKPVTEAEVKKLLEPDISGGKHPDTNPDKGKKS